MRLGFVATYSNLDNYVSDRSIAKSGPRSRATGVTDLLEDDTLIEVDSVVSNITRKRYSSVDITKDLRFALTRGTKMLRLQIEP